MMLKGEAIDVVSNHVFYADGWTRTTVRRSGAAIPPHDFRQVILTAEIAQVSLSLADTAGKPKFRLDGAGQIETLAIANVASPMWERALSC